MFWLVEAHIFLSPTESYEIVLHKRERERGYMCMCVCVRAHTHTSGHYTIVVVISSMKTSIERKYFIQSRLLRESVFSLLFFFLHLPALGISPNLDLSILHSRYKVIFVVCF